MGKAGDAGGMESGWQFADPSRFWRLIRGIVNILCPDIPKAQGAAPLAETLAFTAWRNYFALSLAPCADCNYLRIIGKPMPVPAGSPTGDHPMTRSRSRSRRRLFTADRVGYAALLACILIGIALAAYAIAAQWGIV